jgi:hypothetical protein
MSGAAAAFRILRSPALAVALLLALAALSAVGTATTPAGPEGAAAVRAWEGAVARVVGLQQTFSSPLFLSLVALSAANVVACTWHRLATRRETPAGRRRAVTDVLIHASVLIVVAGGVAKAVFGFIGTQNIHVGGMSDTVYDWKAGRDAPLGFAIVIDGFRTGYFPVRARIGVRAAGTGEKVGLLEVTEGAETAIPGGDARVSVLGYDGEAGRLRVGVTARGVTDELTFGTAGDQAVLRSGAYDLSLVAYRADLRDVHASISLHGPGGIESGLRLGPNDRIAHGGLSLFLTAWGTDPDGRRFCGVQVVRDPGAPVFWAGCVLLALAIPLHALARERGSKPGAGRTGGPVSAGEPG